MTHFAEIDPITKIVKRVIVIEKDEIDSGKWGNPENWIQTSYNSNMRERFAGVGYTYDKKNDIFVKPKPFRSWKRGKRGEWIPPKTKPENTHNEFWVWDEVNNKWVNRLVSG